MQMSGAHCVPSSSPGVNLDGSRLYSRGIVSLMRVKWALIEM